MKKIGIILLYLLSYTILNAEQISANLLQDLNILKESTKISAHQDLTLVRTEKQVQAILNHDFQSSKKVSIQSNKINFTIENLKGDNTNKIFMNPYISHFVIIAVQIDGYNVNNISKKQIEDYINLTKLLSNLKNKIHHHFDFRTIDYIQHYRHQNRFLYQHNQSLSINSKINHTNDLSINFFKIPEIIEANKDIISFTKKK